MILALALGYFLAEMAIDEYQYRKLVKLHKEVTHRPVLRA
jgi:hypothetical protein